ncbi:MAG TPA: protein kinase [Polyangiaceae bacterium]|jgi:serine/threonine-protein kinase|nr:protein kinase [Polyangiaceae bacterium]
MHQASTDKASEPQQLKSMAPPKPVEPASPESMKPSEPATVDADKADVAKADAPKAEAPKADAPKTDVVKTKSKKQELAESMDADLPKKFGRLTLLRTIARGGMGEVFLATAGGIEGAERPCVVKIIRREHGADPSFLARFFDEARIQAQLDHPGVARVVEAATDPSGKPFVVVEYVEGRNLAEVRNRGSQLNATINWAEAVAVGVAMTEALAHVHERLDANGVPLGIVHRDLSPQNVMVGYSGDVKLIDFGTARGENRRCHTVSGVVLAKPGYVAPEVANSQPGGVAADLYAVGIILWELVAGRRFLTGEPSAHVAAVAAGKRNPPPIAELVKAPAELDTLVALLTAPRIEDRMPSARQASAEFVRILKKAPSLANGERGVRARIANVMGRLYPAEPAKSRAELGRLLALSRSAEPKPETLPAPSPAPGPVDESMLPGTRYRILREIGRGAMGVVYEATHVDLGRVVALKVLPKERCASTEHEIRFRNEARASARLRHPNLVGLHDFGVAGDGRPFYAMEMLEGETLERHLERERGMDWREAIRVGLEMCAALECAHEASLVHRDIKPGNVFLTRDGKVKLLDFGLVQSNTEKPVAQDPESLKLTGTVEYMAPEQAAGETVDERADLYAVGAVLYELVTGRLPHVALTALALVDRKLRTMPEPACERAPGRGIPKALDQVIMKALSRYPTQRYRNATEMRAALDAALLAPSAQRRMRRIIAAAALASTATLAAMFAVKSSHDPAVRARAVAVFGPTAHKMGLRTLETAEARTAPVEDAPVATLYEAPKPAALPAAAPAVAAPVAAERASAAPGESDAEDDDGTAAPSDVAPNSGPAPAESEPEGDGNSLDSALARAENFAKKGLTLQALGAYRKLGARHGDDARILRGWSQAAIKTKGWGEALRVSVRWASIDSSPEAQLYLAKIQRSAGQRYGALATLNRLLEHHPDVAEAHDLLDKYADNRKLASR